MFVGKKSKARFTSLIRACLFAAVFSGVLPQRSSAQDGLELLQRTAMGGEYVVDATVSSLKIVKKGTPVVIFAQAPQWTVYIYNKASKKFYATAPEKFQGSFANSFYGIRGDDPKAIRWRESNQEVYCGMPAVHLVAHREDTEKNLRHYSMKQWQGATRGDCILIKNFAVPKVIPDLICKYYGIPTFERIPLSLTHFQTDHTSVALKTLQAKTLFLSNKDFQQPKNFIKAVSEAAVIYDPDEIPVL